MSAPSPDVVARRAPAPARITGWLRLGPGGGLIRRTAIGGALLALIVAAAFGVLIQAIDEQRDSARLARATRDELIAVDRFEKLVLDLETGVRGFVITGDERFLEPWETGRAALPTAAASLRASIADDPDEQARTDRIIARTRSYVDEYALPLIAAVREGDASTRSVFRTQEGKERIDALRREFAAFRTAERGQLTVRQDQADAAATRAATAGVVGLVASVLLITLFTAYFGRAIVRPVRRAAAMAGRLAGGELSARMPETGVGEIGLLERSFNTMGRSLQESRAELELLAREQSALRHVATVVAQGATPSEVFASVAEEAAQLLGGDMAKILRYEGDGTATVVGGWSVPGKHIPLGTRLTLEGAGPAAEAWEAGRPARVDSFEGPDGSVGDCFRRAGVPAGVGSPVVVEGRIWGVAVLAAAAPESLVPGTELRLASFAELVATGIANAEARAELRQIAEEQAALRRVATLVAQAGATREVFETVTREVGLQSDADYARMERFESDGTVTAVAAWARSGEARLAVGARFALEGTSIASQVRETGRPARVDSFAGASGPIAHEAQAAGIRSSVGCPIVVNGRTWGVIAASTTRETPFPPDTESRIADFTELAATAIANAESRRQLAASRARIVTAGDQARRRIERDLHDGAQQRLVSLALTLRSAEEHVPADLPELREELARTVEGLEAVLADLQEISRGIHPAILSEGGLAPALRTLARRSAVPVELNVDLDERLSEQIEVAAYYVVSEALTNAAKHASASVVYVDVGASEGELHIFVRDDGAGGADAARGSGLVGLADRVEALGGAFAVTSPPGEGTSLAASLPMRVADRAPVGAVSG